MKIGSTSIPVFPPQLPIAISPVLEAQRKANELLDDLDIDRSPQKTIDNEKKLDRLLKLDFATF